MYLVGALSYIVAVTATYLMKVPMGGRVARTKDSWFTTFKGGFQFTMHRPVILGERFRGEVELRAGMEAGEQVVIAGQHRLADGDAVATGLDD